MADNTLKKLVRLEDLKRLAQRNKAVTDSLSGRVSDLEKLARRLLELTNSIIANIEREE